MGGVANHFETRGARGAIAALPPLIGLEAGDIGLASVPSAHVARQSGRADGLGQPGQIVRLVGADRLAWYWPTDRSPRSRFPTSRSARAGRPARQRPVRRPAPRSAGRVVAAALGGASPACSCCSSVSPIAMRVLSAVSSVSAPLKGRHTAIDPTIAPCYDHAVRGRRMRPAGRADRPAADAAARDDPRAHAALPRSMVASIFTPVEHAVARDVGVDDRGRAGLFEAARQVERASAWRFRPSLRWRRNRRAHRCRPRCGRESGGRPRARGRDS